MRKQIRINDQLYQAAKSSAAMDRLSIAGQIELWAKVGKAALDNPDLPTDFIHGLLLARAEGCESTTPFVPQGSPANRR